MTTARSSISLATVKNVSRSSTPPLDAITASLDFLNTHAAFDVALALPCSARRTYFTSAPHASGAASVVFCVSSSVTGPPSKVAIASSCRRVQPKRSSTNVLYSSAARVQFTSVPDPVWCAIARTCGARQCPASDAAS
eukprot:30865-Pelagococcus_subviridis.AAC.13